MSTVEYETKKRRSPLIAEVAVIALVFAIMVATCGWLWVGKGSPFNHGVFPDVRTSPDVSLWVIANFPAAILFISLFGKSGPEWTYFLCVLIQWFILGVGVGVV